MAGKLALVKVVAVSGFGVHVFGRCGNGIRSVKRGDRNGENALWGSNRIARDGIRDKTGFAKEGQVANRDILVDDLLG